MPKTKYTSKYFFKQLQKLRQIISTSKKYKSVEELMSAKDNLVEISHLNASQGLEK